MSRFKDLRYISVAGFLLFASIAIGQFIFFQKRPVEDFYQPQGYINRVNDLISEGKLFYATERTKEGLKPIIKTSKLDAAEQVFFEKSWLKEDIEAFNDGNSDVFIVDKGRLNGVNVYRHRIESPFSSDWKWWGRIFSQSSQGYAYLWNSRRTLKLYRASLENRASARPAQSDFRDVIYKKGHLFQSGPAISLKSSALNKIADIYALGDNIVLRSFTNTGASVNGHVLPRGLEQRLEQGDLVQITFEKDQREEYLFEDFSQKPLSFVNVVNGRSTRTNVDAGFQIIDHLADGIENGVRRIKKEKNTNFDVYLALDEDISGVAQTALTLYGRQLSSQPLKAGCTIMDALSGKVLATASLSKKEDDINQNLKLHPVGSATKPFLAAAAAQAYPALLDLEIDPHPVGEEKVLVGYELKEGYKLRQHSPLPGESGRTDAVNYIAKSCNRYHAILMTLALAKDSAAARGQTENLFHGLKLENVPVDPANGQIYVSGEVLRSRPDLSYFITNRPDGVLECSNIENSELALNLERLFGIKRKSFEASSQFFSPDPWNILFARLGVMERPEVFPAFYGVMPQTVNLNLNLNIDFRLDFISIIFGGATNRWNNVQLAEALSRLTTGRKIKARFVDSIKEKGREMKEEFPSEPLGLEEQVQARLMTGMEAVCLPGGTAGNLYPVLQNLREKIPPQYSLELYGKTGTPFRKEIRKGEEELYSSVFLVTAVLRDRSTGKIRDALSFSIYIEDMGEHKAVDFAKVLLPKILSTRRWI